VHELIAQLVAAAFLLGIGLVLVLIGLGMVAYSVNRRR
jgi:hypothetical protein